MAFISISFIAYVGISSLLYTTNGQCNNSLDTTNLIVYEHSNVVVPCNISANLTENLDSQNVGRVYITADNCSRDDLSKMSYIEYTLIDSQIYFTNYTSRSSTNSLIFNSLSLISNETCDLYFKNISIDSPDVAQCKFSKFTFFQELCPVANFVDFVIVAMVSKVNVDISSRNRVPFIVLSWPEVEGAEIYRIKTKSGTTNVSDTAFLPQQTELNTVHNFSITSVFENGLESATLYRPYSRGPVCYSGFCPSFNNCPDLLVAAAESGVCLLKITDNSLFMLPFGSAATYDPEIDLCNFVCSNFRQLDAFKNLTNEELCESAFANRYCCGDKDFCLTNETVIEGIPFYYTCFYHLDLSHCLKIEYIRYESTSSNSVKVFWQNTNFTSVEIEVYKNSKNVFNSTCTTEFTTDAEDSCNIEGLAPNTNYEIRLRGILSQTIRTLPSGLIQIKTGNSLNLQCQRSDSITIKVGFRDIPFSPSLSKSSYPSSAPDGVENNDIDNQQSDWSESTFRSQNLLRGLPLRFLYPNENSTSMSFEIIYAFGNKTYLHGNLFNTTEARYVDLANRCIKKMSGSFDALQSSLKNLKIEFMNLADSTFGNTTCFGKSPQSCGDFQFLAQEDYCLVGLSTVEKENNGEIDIKYIEATWIKIGFQQLFSADMSCAADVYYNVNDFYSSYQLLNTSSQGCGVQTAVNPPLVTSQLTLKFNESTEIIRKENQLAITRNSDFQIRISCEFDSNQTVHAKFETKEEAEAKQASYSTLTFEFYYFKDSQFTEQVTGIPSYSLNSDVYFCVLLSNNVSNISILADEVYATSYLSSGKNYSLLEDGCSVDVTLKRQFPQDMMKIHNCFTTKAFKFSSISDNVVNLVIEVQACNGGSALCSMPSCSSDRKRRDTGLFQDDLIERSILSQLFILEKPVQIQSNKDFSPYAYAFALLMLSGCVYFFHRLVSRSTNTDDKLL